MRDEIEKANRGYTAKNSRVYPNGREVLHGVDWKNRKHELWIRAGGRCEKVNSDGERCRNEAADPHHKVPRSKGRDDRLENLIALCRFHHEMEDWKHLKWSEK